MTEQGSELTRRFRPIDRAADDPLVSIKVFRQEVLAGLDQAPIPYARTLPWTGRSLLTYQQNRRADDHNEHEAPGDQRRPAPLRFLTNESLFRVTRHRHNAPRT
jgi:hypothetical protein